MIGSSTAHHLAAFYVPWMASLAAAAANVPQAGSAGMMIQIDSLSVPVLQGGLALAGVLLARPLAPRKEQAVGWPRFALVTAIMMIVAVVWVAQSHPAPLMAFVVAIGLGFSGYSLIELAGKEIETFVKALFARAAGSIDGKATGDSE